MNMNGNGVLQSGTSTFTFKDSAGNTDYRIVGSGILRSGTTSTTFQDSAGNSDLQITGVGILNLELPHLQFKILLVIMFPVEQQWCYYQC